MLKNIEAEKVSQCDAAILCSRLISKTVPTVGTGKIIRINQIFKGEAGALQRKRKRALFSISGKRQGVRPLTCYFLIFFQFQQNEKPFLLFEKSRGAFNCNVHHLFWVSVFPVSRLLFCCQTMGMLQLQ